MQKSDVLPCWVSLSLSLLLLLDHREISLALNNLTRLCYRCRLHREGGTISTGTKAHKPAIGIANQQLDMRGHWHCKAKLGRSGIGA